MKIFTLLLLIPVAVFSQNHICDMDTKQPIDAVNISYLKNNGLITNQDGFFFLEKNKHIDTLYLSHLSYLDKKVPFKALKENDTIFLKETVINLNDVVISSVNAKKIIKKAVEKIDENYLNTAYNQFGFLRRTVEEDGKGIGMIEVAFTNFYDKNKKKLSTNITNARKTKNYAKLKNFQPTKTGVFYMINENV